MRAGGGKPQHSAPMRQPREIAQTRVPRCIQETVVTCLMEEKEGNAENILIKCI